MVEVVEAYSKKTLAVIKRLFNEYTTSLGFDLHFQNYEREYTKLPGEYARPDGRLYIAVFDRKTAGCVALRKIEDNVCEMKRMYVRPAFRRKGIGRILAEKVIDEARCIGYKKMRLDTIDTMKPAIQLYKSLGFKEIPPYRYNPVRGACYLELVL